MKTTTVLLFGAIACGPVGVVVGLAAGQAQPAVAEVDVQEPLTTAQQGAGEYAAGFVGAWLRATRDDAAALEAYIATSAMGQLSGASWKYRDLTVVSVDTKEGTDLTSVVIAANVQEIDAESKEQTEIWPRRYFAVTVRVSESGLSVIGLPTPVAAPAKAEPPVKLAYTESLPTDSSAATTVEDFLSAYLVGSGDVTRYTSPGVEIRAITPVPYVSLTVTDVTSDAVAGDDPATGDEVHVLAVVDLVSAQDQKLTATYSLSLTARDGRWETTAVDLFPAESSLETTDPSSPSP